MTRLARKSIPDIVMGMKVFDHLPPEYRRFLAEYPRTITAQDAHDLLHMKGGDVAAAIAYVRHRLPVPPDQEAPMVPRRMARPVRSRRASRRA